MSEHSLGPWSFRDEPGCRSIYDVNGQDIAYTSGLNDDDEDQANARLMATASQLLVTLRTFAALALPEDGTGTPDDRVSPHKVLPYPIPQATIHLAREVVARAEGTGL